MPSGAHGLQSPPGYASRMRRLGALELREAPTVQNHPASLWPWSISPAVQYKSRMRSCATCVLGIRFKEVRKASSLARASSCGSRSGFFLPGLVDGRGTWVWRIENDFVLGSRGSDM